MIEVRSATEADLAYIDALQSKYTHELGFLPFGAIRAYVLFKRVSIGLLNGEPASYLLGRDAEPSDETGARIMQACVQYDARHRALGTALVEQFVSSLGPRALHLTLWCAQDLEANLFWESCGFSAKAWRLGKQQKGRVHILWHRPLQAPDVSTPYVLPSRTGAGNMRATRLVVPLRPGESWKDVKPTKRPDIVAAAWGSLTANAISSSGDCERSGTSSSKARQRASCNRQTRRRRSSTATSVATGVPVVIAGRVVYRSSALFAGRN